MSRYTAFVLVLIVVMPQGVSADDLKVNKIDSKPAAPDAVVVGSGSGIVVGPGLVLTNRHVTQDGDRPYAGFRIRIGPDYKKTFDARAIWVCESYDLALLKTDSSLTSDIKVLDGLAPLGTKVTAYGFPLGDQFGIGLTVTGGQVTRHPVAGGGDEEDADIRRSMWHDAVTAGGSSGGPLISGNGVLVGVHFASLVAAKGQALAVPGSAVASLLRKVGAVGPDRIVGLGDFESTTATGNPKVAVVYVEILGSRNQTAAADTSVAGKSELARFGREVVDHIKEFLPVASDEALASIERGTFSPAFKRCSPAEVQPMTVARIAGRMTVIQILADGMLVKMETAKFKIIFPSGGGAELRAKLGDDVITRVPEDGVFIVGRAVEYTTVRGDTSFYIPLLNVTAIADQDQITRSSVKNGASD